VEALMGGEGRGWETDVGWTGTPTGAVRSVSEGRATMGRWDARRGAVGGEEGGWFGPVGRVLYVASPPRLPSRETTAPAP